MNGINSTPGGKKLKLETRRKFGEEGFSLGFAFILSILFIPVTRFLIMSNR